MNWIWFVALPVAIAFYILALSLCAISKDPKCKDCIGDCDICFFNDHKQWEKENGENNYS